MDLTIIYKLNLIERQEITELINIHSENNIGIEKFDPLFDKINELIQESFHNGYSEGMNKNKELGKVLKVLLAGSEKLNK
jgi:hypothetical protein